MRHHTDGVAPRVEEALEDEEWGRGKTTDKNRKVTEKTNAKFDINHRSLVKVAHYVCLCPAWHYCRLLSKRKAKKWKKCDRLAGSAPNLHIRLVSFFTIIIPRLFSHPSPTKSLDELAVTLLSVHSITRLRRSFRSRRKFRGHSIRYQYHHLTLRGLQYIMKYKN